MSTDAIWHEVKVEIAEGVISLALSSRCYQPAALIYRNRWNVSSWEPRNTGMAQSSH